MKHAWFSPFAAFQPPSDMVGDGGGSSGARKVFIGLGIGCGVVLLVLGILFAAGAFEALKCCNQFKGIAEGAMGAQQFANGFADDVWSGRLDDAYNKTSADFQKGMDKDAFTSAVEAHRERMKSNQPRMFAMNLEQHGGDKPSLEDLANGSWMMSYQFAGPKDQTMLLLNFHVAQQKDTEPAFVVSDIKFDERARSLQHEPPAAEVLKVHDKIQAGQYEMAYNSMGDGFRTSTDMDTWRKFLEDAGPVLTNSTLEIREVGYSDSNRQATVMAHAKATSGENAIIQFELVPMQPDMPGLGWRVVSIAPLVADSNNAPPTDPAVPATNGTNNANNATNAGSNGTQGALPVKVKVDVK